MKLNLQRPLAFFDLETTGIDIAKDRVVEISIVKVHPGEEETEIKTRRLNPTIPIPEESSKIHGIYDDDVKDAPTFQNVAKSLLDFLDNCDLAGFNVLRFDLPVLVEEFLRADIHFDISNRKVIDAQRIFHLMEPRTLKAAYKFYCGKDLVDAHSAEADTLATYEVLKSQVERYDGQTIEDKNGKEIVPITNDMTALHELTHTGFADLVGRIAYNDNGEEVFNFGKHKNRTVVEVLEKEPSYYNWIMNGDFALSTKKKLQEIRLKNFGKI